MDYEVHKYECADEGEEWAKVPGKEYSVSSFGRVFSWKSRMKYSYRPIGLLMPARHSLGYRYITLDYKPIYLHRLVAMLFVPNPDNLPEVNHIDHDKTNNKSCNLEWVTHKENIQKSFKHGHRTIRAGDAHPLFGKMMSKEVKDKMSAAKMGVKHPKFIGYFIVNGHRFESANQAACSVGRSAAYIMRRCRGGNVPGWSFEPVKKDR